MNVKLEITTANIETLHIPAKALPFLEQALRRGLTVERVDTIGQPAGESNYTVSSTNPIDTWQLWISHTSGRNGGRMTLTRYTPEVKNKATTRKVTQQMARIVVDDMGDALDRHHERQAKKAELNQVAAAVERAQETPALTVIDGTAEVATVAPIRLAPVADTTEAQHALNGLKAAARFAIRVAKNGSIPRNTRLVVRDVLVRRGLVAASGLLTDVGLHARGLLTS